MVDMHSIWSRLLFTFALAQVAFSGPYVQISSCSASTNQDGFHCNAAFDGATDTTHGYINVFTFGEATPEKVTKLTPPGPCLQMRDGLNWSMEFIHSFMTFFGELNFNTKL